MNLPLPTAGNAYGPSKATSSQVYVPISLHRSCVTGYNIRIPYFDDRPKRPPANHQTWFLEHFSAGLIPLVISFYTSVLYHLYHFLNKKFIFPLCVTVGSSRSGSVF